MADEFGVADRVGFTGFVEDAASALRALDVVVHASTAPEPFGLVIAEASACGRAVVASRAGGVLEIIEEGRDALAHTPGDASELAARITELATDANLRASLGRRACPTLETQFALCFEGRLSEELRAAGATVHALGGARVRSPLSVRRARRALSRLLREDDFDVAACHSSWSQALFGAVVRASGL